MKMKHCFLVMLLSALLTVACTTNEIPVVLESSSTIPIDEAVATLNNALSVLKPQTKSGASREIAEVLTVAKNDIIAKASDEKIAYVVNFKDDQGFALLAANRSLPDPIIAIVENGTMDKHLKIHSLLETKGVTSQDSSNVFIEDLIHGYICNEGGGGGGDDDNDNDEGNGGEGGGNGGNGGGGGSSTWSTYYTVDPMLRFHWGQGTPFNMYCPTSSGTTCPAGCVPVALAMIITYNSYPTTLTMNGHTLSWSQMNDAYYYSDGYLHNTSSSHYGVQDVAYFMRQIGDFCDTYYTSGWSFTVPEDAKDFMQDIGYTNATKHVGYDEDDIVPMILAGKPVFIAAISGVLNGHAWVIDGIMRQSKGSETRELLHCNWGWYGSHNGFYASGVFDTTQGPIAVDPEYGDDNTTGSYDFDWWYRIITY